MGTIAESFRLARMSRLMLILTLAPLALPLGFLASAAFGKSQLLGPAVFVVAIYSWVWLRFRPTQFVVRPEVPEVIWPLKRRRIRRDGISGVRLIDARELRREMGWCLRVGAGGCGVDSAGCGRGSGESCRSTSRAPTAWWGSSESAAGRG